jgi:hypothetical protein
MTSHPDTKIDCSKVYVKTSSFATPDNQFDGTFSAVPFKKGKDASERLSSSPSSTFDFTRVDTVTNSPHIWNLLHFLKRKGDLVEKGLMRRLPEGFDGNTCPYIFTWSDERPNKTWGMGSGCAPFYNTAAAEDSNTKMVRYFDEDRFEIFADRDIKKDEELTHTYKSLKWRTCFQDLNEIVHAKK